MPFVRSNTNVATFISHNYRNQYSVKNFILQRYLQIQAIYYMCEFQGSQIYEDVVWKKHLLLCQDLLECHNVCALMPNERVNLFPLMLSKNCLTFLIYLHFSHIHRMLLEWYKQWVKGQICSETCLCHSKPRSDILSCKSVSFGNVFDLFMSFNDVKRTFL